MSRIYGNIEEIDSEKIKKFFNNRAKKDEEAYKDLVKKLGLRK